MIENDLSTALLQVIPPILERIISNLPITVDTTAKAKEAFDGTDRTPGADSGYGTPS